MNKAIALLLLVAVLGTVFVEASPQPGTCDECDSSGGSVPEDLSSGLCDTPDDVEDCLALR